jgi:Chalcone isomerase-like
MKYVKKTLTAFACLVIAVLTTSSQAARSVAGIEFDDQLSLANQTLVLNGAGVRVKMIVKVYAVGLYVPHKDSSPAAILAQPGPKSVRIVMLRDVSADRLADALIAGITDNLSPAERVALQSRLSDMESGMRGVGEVVRGAQIQLDYLPVFGTRVSLGGKPLCKDIAGEDFYRALLKIWLGEQPSDRSLKADLLGQP